MNSGWFSKNFSFIRSFTSVEGRDICMYVFNDDVQTIREEVRKRQKTIESVQRMGVEINKKKREWVCKLNE